MSDPPDGQVPYQPWARAVQQDLLANFFNPTSEEYVEPLARCAPAGPTKSFTWHGYEIRQYPGYVLFLFDSGTRIIHLDGKPHLPENVKLWNGDSRGRWEGNTLVVDVTNNNSKSRLARTGEFVSENATIEERYIFANEGERLHLSSGLHGSDRLHAAVHGDDSGRRTTEKSPQDDWHNLTFPAIHPAATHHRSVRAHVRREQRRARRRGRRSK